MNEPERLAELERFFFFNLPAEGKNLTNVVRVYSHDIAASVWLKCNYFCLKTENPRHHDILSLATLGF